MKKRLAPMGAGAALGAGLLLLFWLLGDVAHVIGLTLEESAFFIGLVMFLVALLLLVRGKTPPKYAAKAEPPKEPGEASSAPFVCLGGGLLDLTIALLMMYVF